MKRTIVPFYSDREAIVAAVLRDAVYYRASIEMTKSVYLTAHPETLTTTRPGCEQEYQHVDEIKPLVQQIERETGKKVLRCWANINKSGHWLGPHTHKRDNISTVACYYAQAGDGEILRFEDGSNIKIKENMFLAFNSNVVHFFDGKERIKDKITLTFELI